MEGNLESSIESFMNILNRSVSELVPSKKSRKNKPKYGTKILQKH